MLFKECPCGALFSNFLKSYCSKELTMGIVIVVARRRTQTFCISREAMRERIVHGTQKPFVYLRKCY